MKYLFFIGLFATGCSDYTALLLTDYTCSQAQMTVVEKQTIFCKDNTGYLASYCYVSAMDRNCQRKDAHEQR